MKKVIINENHHMLGLANNNFATNDEEVLNNFRLHIS